MNDIPWNRIVLDEYRSLCPPTEEEDKVLTDWARGKSVVHTAMTHNMSTRLVDKIRCQIRSKYDAVQIYTPLLPARESVK